jgi:hypothetical protein
MIKDIVFSLVEIGISILFETVILGLIFQQLSNRAVKDNENILRAEMKVIEEQNKFDFQQLQEQLRESKREIISEIKESLSSQ